MKRLVRILMFIGLVSTLVGCLTQHTGIDPAIYKPFTTPTPRTKGLVIVGGGLEGSNVDVYSKFVEMAGGSSARIAVIPTASGRPVKYSNMFINEVSGYGFPRNNIVVVPLAVANDKGTKDFDESTWAENVNKPEIAAMIRSCNAIWFVGGDQRRTTGLLYNEDGSQSLSLQAIWEVYNNGGVIGGTSAGAAVMSDPMIAGGDGWGGFVQPTSQDDMVIEENLGQVGIMRGIGFFDKGMVDQHFDKKGRLGRLYSVMYDYCDRFDLGFGVDENTAMIYYPELNEIQAIGRGSVVIMDVSHMVKTTNHGARNLLISVIEKGDRYNLETRVVTPDFRKVDPATDALQVVGNEYNGHLAKPITGLSQHPYLRDCLGWDLLDNKTNDQIRYYMIDENRNGVEIIFTKITDDTLIADEIDNGAYFGGYTWDGVRSQGWWNLLDGTLDQYTSANVALEVKPVRFTITPRNN